MNTKRLEWLGSLSAIVGAVLLARNDQYSAFGYLFFLVSSFFLVVYCVKVKATGLFWMQMVFVAVNAFGVYRWFFHPLLKC